MATSDKGHIIGPTMLLSSGYYLDITDPSASPIMLPDLAYGLAAEKRWQGQTIERATGEHCEFSVAQHCVEGLRECPEELQYSWLMHEIDELPFGDMCGPFKAGLDDYKRKTKFVKRVLQELWKVPASDEIEQELKFIDRRMMVTERRDLMASWTGETWDYVQGAEPYSWTLRPWTFHQAAYEFMEAFHRVAPEEAKVAFWIAQKVTA